MDPLAEVARNPSVSDLNQGLDPGTISSDAKQPLAAVQILVDTGRGHAQDMLDNDYFSHTGLDGSTPTSRAAALGYWSGVGENIAWNGSTGPIDQASETLTAHNNLFFSASHRENLLQGSYEEAGMAVRFGEYDYEGTTYNVAMVAEQFGFRNTSNPYITGVVFEDGVTTDDDFFSIGESVSDIRITAVSMLDGTSYSTTSGTSGGYNLSVPAGTYTVTASAGLSDTMVVTDVVVGAENVKVDFDTSEATPDRSDVLGLNSGEEFWVAVSDGASTSTSRFAEWPTSPAFSHVGQGDINGDGLEDMVGRTTDGTLRVAIATGDSSFIIDTWGQPH